MQVWKKLSTEQIKHRVFTALNQNSDFNNSAILGLPASYLDPKVFNQDAPFLKDAPFLTALLHNPNHIGCHTLGDSEEFFQGTQKIERELIRICAEDILNGDPEAQDGYVASGGTEANIQAVWMYRNYFIREYGAQKDEMVLISSEDSHYSVAKAANLLGIKLVRIPVDEQDRNPDRQQLKSTLDDLKADGTRYVIAMANMMTTMFGSVDDVDIYTDAFEQAGLPYRLHVDGAYGGFFYPFSGDENPLDFSNPKVDSVVLDAHKMVQAPYGTGILLARKGFFPYVYTDDASYVKGLDATLIGSRSGANAIAVWMILMNYGPHGWHEKIHLLMYRTQWVVNRLDELNVTYYRNPRSNIVTIKQEHVPDELAKAYALVPDDHENPEWYKIVVMDHVTIDILEPFIEKLSRQHAAV